MVKVMKIMVTSFKRTVHTQMYSLPPTLQPPIYTRECLALKLAKRTTSLALASCFKVLKGPDLFSSTPEALGHKVPFAV